MEFPEVLLSMRMERLTHPGRKVRVVIDTDTFNEIDDQFAIAYAFLSPETIQVEALHAVPFLNARVSTPGEGMELSFEEILRLLDRLDVDPTGLVFKGSARFMADRDQPVESDAVADLIRRAMASPDDDPLYVVAIGAMTNVASALLIEPAIVEKIVVLWLGGHALHWAHNREFNLRQDPPSVQVVLDSGVPFVRFPGAPITTHLRTSPQEIAKYVDGKGAIGDFLAMRFYDYDPESLPGWSKIVWDIVTIAWLVDETWTPSEIVHTPILTDQKTWSFDNSRHLMRSIHYVRRNNIFGDLFSKLDANA